MQVKWRRGQWTRLENFEPQCHNRPKHTDVTRHGGITSLLSLDPCLKYFSYYFPKRHHHVKHSSPSQIGPPQYNIPRGGRQVIKVSVQCRIGQERRRRLVGCFQQRGWVGRDALTVEWFIPSVESLHSSQRLNI